MTVKDGGVGIYGVEVADMGLPEEEGGIKLVVNEKVCNDLFVPGDQCMARVCEGGDYHSESCLQILVSFEERV